MNKLHSIAAALIMGATTPATVFAVGDHGSAAGHGAASAMAQASTAMPATASTELVDAEVRKVDKEARKITLRHGEIKSLGMPPMTMVFQIKDAAMLNTVKAGDKVKFNAENVDGAMVVTTLRPAN